MRNAILLAALAAALNAATVPALAECKDEVLAALDKQRKSKAFRMETNMVSENGPVKMTVEYLPPDRMHQVVVVTVDPKPTETLVIGGRAWTKAAEAWEEMPEETAKLMAAGLTEQLGDEAGTIGTVACLGSTALDGQELMAYRIENDAQTGPKDMSPDANDKAAAALADEGRPLRMFYVDPKTGLPVRSVFARANKLESPIFKATYSYPDEIKIEPPAGK